jgi:streptogramin lyase
MVSYSGTSVTSAQSTALIVENPGLISTLAGDIGTSGLVNSTGTAAEFHYPTGITADNSGNFYVADLDNNNIREVSSTGTVTTPYGSPTGVAGSTNGSGNSGTAPFALFDAPRDVAFDHLNNLLYVADEGNSLIRKINLTTGQVTSIGTTGTFSEPRGVAVDGSGNVYVVDSGNNVIRKIAAGGTTVSLYAGSSSDAAGFQDGPATGANSALFNQPIGIAVDGSGNVYVGDYGNEAVRKISTANNVLTVSTIAGQGGVAGCLDGQGTQALFNVPRGITVDSAGNVYVTDSAAPAVVQNAPTYSGNELLRKISPTGAVTTLVGQAGIAGTANGLGSAAQLYNPCGVTIGPNGILYIADAGNNAIRMFVPNYVSVSATVPYASVLASAAGQFTVSRSGSTSSSLTLNYSLANSTAVAGTDYSTLPGTVTIPAGANSVTIAVNPLTDPAATANLTVQLGLTSTIAGTVVSSTPATVTLIEAAPVTFSTWQTDYPDPATPLGDSVPDLAKYVFDIDPSLPMTSSERAALPTSGMMTIGDTTYFTLTYREYAALSGATVTPQMSTDLLNWTAVSTPPTVIGIDSTTQDPIMQVAVPYTGATEFLRLYIAP